MLMGVYDGVSTRKRQLVGCRMAELILAENAPRALPDRTEDDEELACINKSHERAVAAIPVLDRFADGEISSIGRIRRLSDRIQRDARGHSIHVVHVVCGLIWSISQGPDAIIGICNWLRLAPIPIALSTMADVVRDILGNPFRTVAIDPTWQSADVLGLARAIYEDRAFDRMPLLADALMDAGCDNEAMLAHCRSEGPHVRGCWVVDLVLGKE
jgi:hypothetical protein